MSEQITDASLHAYIDGQLDTASRIEVERWLEDHPDEAAAVMEGLRLRDEVRLFLADDGWASPPATVGLARQLARALGRRSLGRRWRGGLAAAVLIAAGWLAHAELDLLVDQVAAAHPVPAFAGGAAEAYEAMRTKLAAGHLPDPEPIPLLGRRTGEPVPVPALDARLHRLGSDLVPWAGGTAVVVLYRTDQGAVVSLFAAEALGFAVASPQAAPVHGLPTVYWQIGPFAYALNGGLPQADLLAIARAAAPRPWTGFTPLSPTEGAIHG